MSSIYKHSHFLPDAFGHGGSKRTAQINQLLSDAGIIYNEANLSNNAIYKNKFSVYFKGLEYTKNIRAGLKNNYAIGRYLKLFEDFVDQQQPQLFIWESTISYNLLIAEILYKKKIPVIALPHNIESLVAGSESVFSKRKNSDWLSEELQYLNYCRKIFTISSNEKQLLLDNGLDTAYLPYYPARAAENFLLGIREKKKQQVKSPLDKCKNILLLGTFYNIPTANGYIELIDGIKGNKEFNILVAGFGSEKLTGIFTEPNIQIWGSVTNETLSDLIINADYGVIHQQPSGGSLTRIPELLLAGLPLLVNIHAARSNSSLTGVSVYNTYAELLQMLNEPVTDMPPILPKPAEERFFTDYVKRFMIDV